MRRIPYNISLHISQPPIFKELFMQLIVLGMHRSGTSMVARILNLMGAYFAPEGQALPPTPDNPKGYWERKDVVYLNEGILANLGATWERVSQFDLAKIPEGLHQEFNQQAETILHGLEAHRPWMMKDPRLCLLFPLWKKLLEVPVCIIVHRNPIQIAQSLHRRDQFSIHFGLALWEFYTLQALRAAQDLPKILISIHDIMTDPVNSVKILFNQLQAQEVQGLRLPSDKEITAFIEPSLIHAKGNDRLQQAYLSQAQGQLVEAIEDGSILEFNTIPPLSAGAETILREHDELFFEREKQQQTLAQQQQHYETQLSQQAEQHQNQLAQQTADHQQQLAQQTETHQNQLARQQADHQAALAQKLTEIESKQQEIQQLYQQLSKKEAENIHYWQNWSLAEDNYRQSQHQRQTLERNYQHLQAQLEAQQQQLRTLQNEHLPNLQAHNQRQYEDLHKLLHWLELLNHDVNAVFTSKTWQMGDMMTKTALRLMFKVPGKTARDHIKQILDSFLAWRVRNLRQTHFQPYDMPALPAIQNKIQIAGLVALHNGEPSASASIRLIQPLQHPTVREEIEFTFYRAHEYLFAIKADFIVIQRHMIPHRQAAEQLIAHCQQHNIKLIYEVDDDLYNIFKKRDLYGNYAKDNLEAIEILTQAAHCVITSSPALQKQIQALNEQVYCVPNALDETLWLAEQNGKFMQPTPQQPDHRVRLLYMGTKTHVEDLQIIKSAYQKIKADYGDQVCLEIVGGVPDGSPVFGEVIEVSQLDEITHDNLDDYPRFVEWFRRTNRWQIGLIPLQVNEFNEKKTYIKFLDYTALGIPCICTDIAPYRAVVQHEHNGLLVKNDTHAWYQAIKKLIDDVNLRSKLATNAFTDLTHHYILQQQAHLFAQPYLDLMRENLAPPAPQSSRHANYQKWLQLHDPLDKQTRQRIQQRIESWENPPLMSIILPTYNTAEKWLRKAIHSVQQQLYPHWELCIADDASTHSHVKKILQHYQKQDSRIKVVFRQTNGHISLASNSALELVSGAYVALLDHDDELTPHALYWVVEEILAHPQAQLIYSDEDKINEQGERFGAYFKCDWNPDLFLSHNLITHLAVYKTDLLQTIQGFRQGFEGAQDYDLALRAIAHLKSEEIRHIPRVLYHWRVHETSTSGNPDAKPYAIKATEQAITEFLQQKGLHAKVQESYIMQGMIRVQYPLPTPAPLVSLIIPTYNQLTLLRQCVDSILEKTTYTHYEILIVDNRSDDIATLDYLHSLQTQGIARILKYPHPFNYAAINNFAVEHADGEVIGLLNNDVEVINGDWLTEMVSHALRPDIGAVGARLWYPQEKLQHGGVLLGVAGVAEHAHKNLPKGQEGYFGRAQITQNFSAVTGACMVLQKSHFLAVGGLDAQHLSIAFNDIDLCLKLITCGLRTVWTPYAELYHYESASRGYEDNPEKVARLQAEEAYIRQRWQSWLDNDPAYNPNLNAQMGDFELAFPPRVPMDKPLNSNNPLPNFPIV